MLDIPMLDVLARGGTVPFRDAKPVFLEDVFTRVVADGWAPRNPAREDEVCRMEQSTLSGETDCLYPLLQYGDTLFSDPNTHALSGDIVCFRLSERGAKVLNGDKPEPGARIWRKGDGWAKLCCRYSGLDVLLTRFDGQSATATLLSCEHPDETPVLHPIRQIIRNGKPLFAPDLHCADIGR